MRFTVSTTNLTVVFEQQIDNDLCVADFPVVAKPRVGLDTLVLILI